MEIRRQQLQGTTASRERRSGGGSRCLPPLSRVGWVEEEGARRKNGRESVGEEGAQGREERIWAHLLHGIQERRPRRYSLRRWRLFFLERGARVRLSVKRSVEGFFAKRPLETAIEATVKTGCTGP
jgi:hypothetical protein